MTQSPYSAQFERLDRLDAPAWLHEIRRDARTRFETLGFPTTRDEEWRFTSVAPIAARSFDRPDASRLSVNAGALEPFLFQEDSAAQLVFVNGVFAPALSRSGSLGTGIEAGSLREAIARDGSLLSQHLGRGAAYEQHAFVALNTASIEDGAYVRIPAGAVVSAPIHLVFVGGHQGIEAVSHPRILVLAGAQSQAQIVESYVGLDGEVYFTNAVTEIVAGENAVVDHYKVVRDSMQAFHIASMHLHLARNANVSSHSITLGGALVRNDVVALLDGEGVDCTLNGLYLSDGQRLVDNHTTIDHAKPHCASHEVYKGILDGKGRAVFNGKIIVRQDAQKTDAKQTNKALLLSEDGQINTKPQLEIFADDVKCTHGATVGQLDEDALFYLQARGIGKDAARNMLIHAFAGDILNRIKHQGLRDSLERTLFERLELSRPSAGMPNA